GKIVRSSNTDWEIQFQVFNDGPFAAQNTTTTNKMYASATTGTVTLTSDTDVFTADMVGQLVKIQVETYETWKPWEAGGFLTNSSVTGLTRRHNGNVYQATEPAAVTGKIRMGGTAPTHLEGEEWDGAGEQAENYDGTPAHDDNYGVKWLYLHSGYGVARIVSVGGPTSAGALVVQTFPAEVVGSGNKSYRWSIGDFDGVAGYPRSCAIFEERLMFGK